MGKQAFMTIQKRLCCLTLFLVTMGLTMMMQGAVSYRRVVPLSSASSTRRMSRMMAKVDTPLKDKKFSFGLGRFAFSGLPLSPESVGRRKTLLTEVVKDSIWTLDQVQGIINVNVPVRCTIIKLSSGGLFVNNPVAPTPECIEYVRSIEAKHGPVKYICLSTLGIEAIFSETVLYL